jgi:hypothetical protein
MKEPNCDMPWEIYLDWLQDQGNEDLRDMNCASLVVGDHNWQNYIFYFLDYSGEGYSGDFTDGEAIVRDYVNNITSFSGYGGDIHCRDSGCNCDNFGDGCGWESGQNLGHGYCGRIEISDNARARLRDAVGHLP